MYIEVNVQEAHTTIVGRMKWYDDDFRRYCLDGNDNE